MDTALEELFTRTIPGEMLPLGSLINTGEGYKNRKVTLLLLHHPCLAEDDRSEKIKVVLSNIASAETGSAHSPFLLLQLWKQL